MFSNTCTYPFGKRGVHKTRTSLPGNGSGTDLPARQGVYRYCVRTVVWMVVRFVGVIRVPLCARVFRLCPVVSRLPPDVFLPVTPLERHGQCQQSLLPVFPTGESARRRRGSPHTQ